VNRSGLRKISAKDRPSLLLNLLKSWRAVNHFKGLLEAAYERLVVKGTAFRALDSTGLSWTEIDNGAQDTPAANAIF